MLLQGKKISCPTCRARTKVTDVAYVDTGRGVASQEGEGGEPSCSSAAQEAAIQVEGSYGTKVSSSNLLPLPPSAYGQVWFYASAMVIRKQCVPTFMPMRY